MASKVWPSLTFVYITTAYFLSQEMITKLTNISDCSEVKVMTFDVSFLPCNGVIIEGEVRTDNVMLTDCTLFLFIISSVAKSCWFLVTSSHHLPGYDQI